jgi:hypothetical protein
MSRLLPTIEGLINEDPIFVVSIIGKNRSLNLETIERLVGLQPFKVRRCKHSFIYYQEKPKICIEKGEGSDNGHLLANKQVT